MCVHMHVHTYISICTVYMNVDNICVHIHTIYVYMYVDNICIQCTVYMYMYVHNICVSEFDFDNSK